LSSTARASPYCGEPSNDAIDDAQQSLAQGCAQTGRDQSPSKPRGLVTRGNGQDDHCGEPEHQDTAEDQDCREASVEADPDRRTQAAQEQDGQQIEGPIDGDRRQAGRNRHSMTLLEQHRPGELAAPHRDHEIHQA